MATKGAPVWVVIGPDKRNPETFIPLTVHYTEAEALNGLPSAATQNLYQISKGILWVEAGTPDTTPEDDLEIPVFVVLVEDEAGTYTSTIHFTTEQAEAIANTQNNYGYDLSKIYPATLMKRGL